MNSDNSQFCVNIYCVMPVNCTEATCPKNLFAAFECCKENSFNVTWVQEEECMNLKPCKEDVFILSEFTGVLFDHLKRYKCTIIGPQCLLVSVHKGEPLPEVPSPVFTVAMKGLTVTSTGCNGEEKKEIADKVQYMGGIYTSAFHGNVTHLIVKNVAEFSQKYKVAISRDIPVMTTKWIDAVWSASCKESVHGTDPAFAKYACPPFQGLVVCVSQIAMKDRDALKKVIEANGGQYSGQLEMGKTNILITPVAEGEKYVYAKRWKIRCLKPDWVYQSLNKGFAVDPEKFGVDRSDVTPRCSTPEADHSVMKFGNGSVNSTILNESQIHNVNETANSVTFQPEPKSDPIEQLDLGQARKAGPFLDGCKVFLSGFDGPQMEKLRRIVNGAGVARFNSISESLTHFIAGGRVEDHWKQLEQLVHKPHVVTVEWVVQSYRLKRAAPESGFLHPDFKVSVDVTKENNVTRKTSVVENDADDQETQMVQQYLNTDQSTYTETEAGIFSGLTFQLVGTETEFNDLMNELIPNNGGRLVSSNAKYVVIDFGHQSPVAGAIEVNSLWVEDCVDREQVTEIEFYHQPMKVADGQILAGCVIAQSGIEGRLRTFLSHMVCAMGGIAQDTFARRTIEAKNIYACTHLVCPKPEGRKYEAAQSWGVAAVDTKWLLACAVSGTRQNESEYPPGTEKPVPVASAKSLRSTQSSSSTRSTPVERQSVELRRDEATTSGRVATPELVAPVAIGSVRDGDTSGKMGTPTPNNVMLQNVNQLTPLESQPRAPLFNIPTPQTPYGRLLNTDPSPDTRKMWKHALDNRVRLTPRLLEEVAEDQVPVSGEVVVDPEAHGYFENLRKKFRFDDAAGATASENECRGESPTQELRPFQGVVAFIHKKLEDQRSELIRAVEVLGGEIRWQHCKEVTHFVYQGKLAASKEMRSAKEWQQKFVAPQWILDCEDAQIRLDEAQYPPSLNPKMALSISVNSQQPASQTQKRRLGGTPRTEPRNSQRKRLNQDVTVPQMAEELEELEEDKEIAVDPIAEEQEPEEEVGQEATRELLQFNQILSRTSEANDPCVKKANPVTRNNHVFVPSTQPLVPQDTTESQSGGVVWDLLEVQKEVAEQPRYCIMFSTMDQNDRDKYAKIIETLGGKVSTLNYYDSSATHIVVVRPVRNEKLVSSIAAGKWVLCPDWLDASARENRFVDEKEYEWGSPSSLENLRLDEGTQEANVAAAAHRWRLKRSQGLANGPFQGMKAILHVRDKSGAFQRLLEAGGGEVVDKTIMSSSPSLKEANVCIVDPKQVASIDMAALANNGIYCVPFVYLNTVLTSVKKPSWYDSVVSEFKPHLDTMPASY